MKKMSRNISLVAAAIVFSLGLSGCDTLQLKSVTATGKCSMAIGGTASCEASVVGTWEPKDEDGGDGGGGGMKFLSMLTLLDEVPDAANFTMDISGSSMPFPTTGSMNVILTDSTTGIIQGSRVFTWVRSGTIIRLQNPDAVNDWAIANGGSADTIDFKIVPFATILGFGTQTLAVAAKNEGQTLASFSKTLKGGCTSYPSPYQCPMM